MQGEVTVPYTSIGGTNMDSGIMMANLGGSSGQYDRETGELISTVSVRWNLPGGIVNSTDGTTTDGLWGYLVTSMADQNSHICYDSCVIQHLKDYGIEDPINDYRSVSILNGWIRSYVTRILSNDGLDKYHDYTTFQQTFVGCLAYA